MMIRIAKTSLVVTLIVLMLTACQGVENVGTSSAGVPAENESTAMGVISVADLESRSVTLSEAVYLPTPAPVVESFEPEMMNSTTLTAVAPATSAPDGCQISADADYEDTVLRLINQERAEHDLGELTSHPQLYAAAREHSLDMACNDYFSHNNRQGRSSSDRIQAAGYTFTIAGENLYAATGKLNDPAKAVEAWMNSPSHRDNILNASILHIGVSYVFNPESRYGGYVTVTFACP